MMKWMKKIAALALALLLCHAVLLPAYGEGESDNDELDGKVAIACVGDSITKGVSMNGILERNYPAVLGELLGDDYAVINFGNPGATLQDEGVRPYTSLPEYQASLDVQAQVYIIMLGTNDSVEGTWDAERYEKQLGEKVDTYLAASDRAIVYLMTPPQTYVREGKETVVNGIRTDVINDEICPIVKKVARQKGVEVIDLNKFTVDHADWFADGVHPTEDGYAEVAQFVYEAILPGLATLEGYQSAGDGYTVTTRWCKNGDKNIFGMLYVPEDYDGTQQYPTIIMSHGLSDTHRGYDSYAPLMAAQGFVCYAFDFCTGTVNCTSDGDPHNYSVITETEDLKAVMDFVKDLDCVDTAKLVLMGQSMGGLVTALVAAQRADEAAAVVLFYPALMIPEDIREMYPNREDLPAEPAVYIGAELGPIYYSDLYDVDVYATIGAYTNPVYIVHGDADKAVPILHSERALEVYENAQLQTIEGGMHGFPPIKDAPNPREVAYNGIMDFLRANDIVQ